MAKKVSKGSGKRISKVEVNLEMTPDQREGLLHTLETRFRENMDRHSLLEWEEIGAKLEATPDKLSSLHAMESTGGEPDVIGQDEGSGEFVFCDCSENSPAGRRSICYDREGQEQREKKGVYPGGNAVDLAAEMGVELLDEEQYRNLQQLGAFDTATSSWIRTPDAIRSLGGAVFGDRRYDHVFIYHNGAHTFYGARGFRGILRV